MRAPRWYLLVSLPLLGACLPPTGPDLAEIGGGLLIEVRESHVFQPASLGEPQITLQVETGPIGICATLDATLHVDGQDLILSVHGVGPPQDTCMLAPSGARFWTVLPVESGRYTLHVRFVDRTDLYVLDVSPSALELHPVRTRVSRARHPWVTRHWRYPPLSFAFTCRRGSADPDDCSRISTRFTAELGLRSFSFPLGGIVPYPVDDETTYYVYSEEADVDRAWDIVRPYLAIDHVLFGKDGVVARVVTWRNERRSPPGLL